MIYEKTYSKSNNSIEAKILETLKQLSETDPTKDKSSIVFSNKQFEEKFKEIADSKDNPFDVTGSTIYLPDGTKVSKYRISQLLKSKFDAKPVRTNQFRGYSVLIENIEKIAKQYEVIEDIIIHEDKNSTEGVTEVTQVTQFKDASPSFSSISNTQEDNHGEINSDRSERGETNPKTSEDYKSDSTIENEVHSDNNDNVLENKTKDTSFKESQAPAHNLSTEIEENNEIPPPIPSKCVTSVTNVTATPPQYPCYFCGHNYRTHIDFDMELHLLEKHKQQMLRLPIKGNLDERGDYLVNLVKKKIRGENTVGDFDDYEL